MSNIKDQDILQESVEPFCISYRTSAEHINVNGKVHGGVMYYLCDDAIGRYVTAMGRTGAAADGNIHYYRPGTPGEKMTATVLERKLGRRLGTFAVELRNEAGTLLADCLFTVMFSD